MRKRVMVLGAVALGVALAGACGDSTDPAPIDGTMHATIVGSNDPWDADKSLSATMTNGKLVITGTEKSSITIKLTIHDAAVGTFTAHSGEAAPQAEASFGDNRSFTYAATQPPNGSLTITITELSETHATGTFEFLAFPVIFDLAGTASYRVVGGTFDVTIK